MYISNKTCKRHARKLIKQNLKQVIEVMIFTIGMLLLTAMCSVPWIPKNFNVESDPVPVGLGIIILIIIFAIWLPLINGANKYCINLSRGNAKTKDIFNPLVKKYFVNLIRFTIFSFTTLVLFMQYCIPGLIFIAIYAFVPIILLDNPDEKIIKAMTKSRKLTIKKLGRIIWMYISFIPWFLTIPFTFNISAIYVLPYFFITMANMYRTMNGEDLEVNIATVYTVEDVKQENEVNSDNNEPIKIKGKNKKEKNKKK